MSRRSHRRDFLKTGAALGVGYWVSGVSSTLVARSALEKINVACVGVGGKGSSDTDQAARLGELVAICDIDDRPLDAKGKAFPKAKKYHDFRKMLEEMDKQIDAVVVSTPDHTHALASVMAMKMRKHVYCQKPLTHTVYEARVMRETAAKMKVATQMGNQGTAADGLRRAAELVQAGAIGQVKEAHVWTNRPIWPQAPSLVKRPAEEPIPAHVKWDLFLGGAPDRPYSAAIHPFKWRGFWDYGTGALGDMACHTANMAFMALKLGYPTLIWSENGEINPDTYPAWARVTFQFPARGSMPECKFVWYEGKKDGINILPSPQLVAGQGKRPSGPSIYFEENKWQFRSGPDAKPKTVNSGSFLIGTDAVLFSPDDYGAQSFILTKDSIEEVKGKPEKMASNGGGDQGMKDEWARAMRGGPPAVSNFDYAAMLTETILLGNVAMRFAGQKLQWDGPEMRITNVSEANKYLKSEYRQGWSL
jgi:predicted dehydrogenase